MASLLQNIRGNSNIVTKLQKQEIRAKFFQKCICIEQIYYISKLSISGVTLHGGRHYLRQQPFYFIGILFLHTIESFKSYTNLSTYIMIIGPDLGKLYGLIVKKFVYDTKLKADLIKLVNLNSTYLNFYYYFGGAESSYVKLS